MKIKPLIAVVIIFIISVIGGTLAALYTNSVTLKNVFGTRGYHTDITEEFISPDDWTPGTTTDKKVFVENTGQVDAEVRISYKESWVSASGKQLSLKQGDNVAAIINFTDNGDWTKDGEYYYYNKVLKPGDKTT